MIDLLDEMKKGEVFSNLDKVFSEQNLPNLLVNYLKILNWCLHVTIVLTILVVQLNTQKYRPATIITCS